MFENKYFLNCRPAALDVNSDSTYVLAYIPVLCKCSCTYVLIPGTGICSVLHAVYPSMYVFVIMCQSIVKSVIVVVKGFFSCESLQCTYLRTCVCDKLLLKGLLILLASCNLSPSVQMMDIMM